MNNTTFNHSTWGYTHYKCRCEICIAAMRNTKKKYAHAHPEKISEQNKRYRTRHSGEHKKRLSAYYRKNKERISGQKKEYANKHKESISEKQKSYYKAHSKQLNEYTRNYYKKNKPRIISQKAEYYKSNKDKINAWRRAYNQTPAGRLYFAIKRHKRRSLQLGAKGVTTKEQFEARWNYYGGLCTLKISPKCTKYATTMDHVIPLALGGTNWAANLRPACKSCNSKKGARFKGSELKQ